MAVKSGRRGGGGGGGRHAKKHGPKTPLFGTGEGGRTGSFVRSTLGGEDGEKALSRGSRDEEGGGIRRRRRRRLEKRSFPLPARRNFIPFRLGSTRTERRIYGIASRQHQHFALLQKKGKKDGDG